MKKVIITGVSEGLGYEVAKIFIARGTQVIGLSRNKPDLDIIHYSVDFFDENALENIVNKIKAEHKDFDAVINCAGILTIEKLNNIEYRKLENLFKVNVFAPIKIVSILADEIKENGADIVNVSSTVGLKAYPQQCAYGASKWSLRGVTENFQLEFKGTKTRVIGFHPGGFKSRIFEKATGIKADLTPFMEASDMAKVLVSTLDLPKNMEVSHIVINRK